MGADGDLLGLFRRVVCRHWAIFLALLALGATGGYFVRGVPQATYTAAARVAVTSASALDAATSAAMADSARAIVTSQAHLSAALAAAGLDANTEAGQPTIAVEALGNSGVLELRVRDTDPEAAAALANSLAADLASTGLPGSRAGADADQLSQITQRIAGYDQQIAALDAQLDHLQTDSRSNPTSLTVLTNQRSSLVEEKIALQNQSAQVETATGLDPGQRDATLHRIDSSISTANGQIAQVDAQLKNLQAASDGDPATAASVLSNRRTNLVDERLAAQSQRAGLLQDWHPMSVLDVAAKPSHPDAPKTVADAFLGAIAGLVLAGLIASLCEVLSPVAEGDAVARSLGVPVLGRFGSKGARSEQTIERGIGPNLVLAAARARVKRIELVTLESRMDLAPLSTALQRSTAHAHEALEIQPYSTEHAVELAASHTSTAAVAVVPDRTRTASRAELANLLEITGWPLLGTIRCSGEMESRQERETAATPAPANTEAVA